MVRFWASGRAARRASAGSLWLATVTKTEVVEKPCSGARGTLRTGIAALENAPPLVVLAILVCSQIVIWTAVPRLLAISLPLDVVSDGLGWGHEWQWGYYKHPPLPSWAVEFFFDLFGDTGPFLLSQLAIGATYGLVFLIGREMMPPRQALAGTLLLVGVYYFSIPTPEFNHNVAQMPVWAAATFAYCKTLKTRRLRPAPVKCCGSGVHPSNGWITRIIRGKEIRHHRNRRRPQRPCERGVPRQSG